MRQQATLAEVAIKYPKSVFCLLIKFGLQQVQKPLKRKESNHAIN